MFCIVTQCLGQLSHDVWHDVSFRVRQKFSVSVCDDVTSLVQAIWGGVCGYPCLLTISRTCCAYWHTGWIVRQWCGMNQLEVPPAARVFSAGTLVLNCY